MKLIDTKTGEKLGTSIEKLIKSAIKKLKGNKKFTFDWTLEVENNVYKINLIEGEEIFGFKK